MQSTEDRRRLAAQYSDGPARPLVAVLKCAAGIAVLFVVAAGPWLVLSADGTGAPEARERTAARPCTVPVGRRAPGH